VIAVSGLVFLYMVMANFTGVCVPAHLIFAKKLARGIFNNEITIPICEMAIVGFSLFAIFVALVLLTKHDRNAE